MELEFPRFFLYLATDVCQDTSDATDELDSDNDRRVIYQQKFASAIVPFFPQRSFFDLRFELFRFLKIPARNILRN